MKKAPANIAGAFFWGWGVCRKTPFRDTRVPCAAYSAAFFAFSMIFGVSDAGTSS